MRDEGRDRSLRCLFVYRIKSYWFGQLTESKLGEGGGFREITNIVVPQSEPEIEAFARRNGYEIEWDLDSQDWAR